MSNRRIFHISRICFGLLLGVSIACGKPEEPAAFSAVDGFEIRATRSFTGTWAMKLKGTKDGCGLGLKGTSFPGTISIVQSGRKVRLAIEGVPKSFKGTVSGTSLTTTGTYQVEGFVLRGTIAAQLTGARTIKLTTAKLEINTGIKTCTVFLSGSGKR